MAIFADCKYSKGCIQYGGGARKKFSEQIAASCFNPTRRRDTLTPPIAGCTEHASALDDLELGGTRFIHIEMDSINMAENVPNRRSSTPSTIPQKRPLGLDDEQHIPAVPSPLNPDFATSRARRPPAPREQREKKESLKKREAKGVEGARAGTPDSHASGRKTKKGIEKNNVLSLIRYKLPAPNLTDFDPPKPPILVPVFTKVQRQFYEASEQYVASHTFTVATNDDQCL